ncbi:branched-chain amino acid ABC transporter permease [Alicyclobacillus sp. ALC3]|uniref:branched-chain amino acid ABC transporter permease n=1 Tax=Alicyclobacillus sp. ALC3 TaxID=2796143 RepID=UPI0023784896|nr:branched-chain amino acid ABC transporter permease [Alicyclobacillus sp. ALC3]WDL97646.1 branched-chain amino acid ABC transporter permease [Alicyclobacillus sp. ALC3]
MSFLVGQILAGLFIGAFYAMVALGYTMVYGIMRLINFAHGDLYMIGAYFSFTVLGLLGAGTGNRFLVIAGVMVLVMALVGLLGMLIERVAYKPLRRAPLLSVMITALGVSMTLENGVLVIPGWGSQYLVFPASLPNRSIHIFGYQVTAGDLIILGVACLLMVLLYWFVHGTVTGKTMRAIAIDKDASALMGININRTIAITFLLGAALAGAAGVLGGLYYGQINYLMGFSLGLEAFTAAVLGGIGNIPGAMLGGFLLGILQSVGSGYLGSQWATVFTFGILIILLTIRPTGILGEKTGVRM